jgi:hypothetical protein
MLSANLRRETSHWMELARLTPDDAERAQALERAENLLRKTKQAFGASQPEDMWKHVDPDLGHVLVEQHEVQEAADLLAPLVDEKKANRDTAYDYARALAGWIEYVPAQNGGQPQIRQIPGVGGAEAFEKASATLQSLEQAADNWTPDDYRYRTLLIHAYWQYGQLDGKKLDVAKGQLRLLSTPLGPTFSEGNLAPPDETRQKLMWLQEKLK